MPLSERDKKVLVWGGVICALILFYTYLFDPLLKSFNEQGSELHYQRSLLQKYRSIATHREEVEKLATGVDEKSAELDKKFLQGETDAIAVANLQAQLSKLAASVRGSEKVVVGGKSLQRPLHPISFLRSRVEKPKPVGKMVRLSVRIEFNTRIRSLLKFLDLIEKSVTVFSISKLSVTVVDIRHPKDLRVSMMVSGYIRSEQVSK